MTSLIKRLWDDQYVGFAEEFLNEMRAVTRGGREAAEKAMLTRMLEATQVRDRIHELFDAARTAVGDDSASAGSLGLTCLPREADVESFLSACMAGVPIEIREPALRIVISHASLRGCFKEGERVALKLLDDRLSEYDRMGVWKFRWESNSDGALMVPRTVPCIG